LSIVSNNTVKNIIMESKNILLPIDIYCLLTYSINKNKEFLFAHPEYELSSKEMRLWENYKTRRLRGEPASYITGKKEFYSLVFDVNRFTLIPRPETEVLVDEVIRINPKYLLDIGTGCGNIAITVKYYLDNCSISAVDISKEALKIAKKNEMRILRKKNIIFIQSNFFKDLDLKKDKFDLIVSNPPYIKSNVIGNLQKEVSNFEPKIALDGGEDGLDAYRTIFKESRGFLRKKGKIVVEIDSDLKKDVEEIAHKNGFIFENLIKDISNMDRVMVFSIMS